MAIRLPRLALILAAAATALASVTGQPATPSLAATVSCPSVAVGTGAVTPAPAPGVDWQGCNLSGAVVYDADLSGANLSGANLTGAEITGTSDVTDANLFGATMTNTMLQADFSGSDLAGANLTDENDLGSSFTGADLHDVNLSGADLQPATLADVESGGITASPLPTLPALWQLSSGYLTGPGGVDFDGQNLTGLVLKNVNLSGSQFVGANLTGANLTNDNLADSDVQNADFTGVTWGAVESGGIMGTPAELTAHWGIVAGYLIGPGAGLVGADLAAANLTGADLAGADLYTGTLAGANLTNADLRGPGLLDVVNVTGASWSNTICPDGSNSNADDDTCVNNNDDYPPAAAPKIDAGPTAGGGFYSYVTVVWHWTDVNATINPNACPAATTSSVQGNPATITATCLNAQGGVGTASIQVKIANKPPAVTVTGVRPGGVYAVGHVPTVACRTTDSISGVRTGATLKVTSRSQHGAGAFTVRCSGASNNAGISQRAPVAVHYTVTYGLTGFSAPGNHTTLRRSAREIAVTFRLLGAGNRKISASVASQLASRRLLRARLAGPGIRSTVSACVWQAGLKALTCDIRTPAGIRTGRAAEYTVTVLENVGSGFVAAVPTGRTVNPETVSFR